MNGIIGLKSLVFVLAASFVLNNASIAPMRPGPDAVSAAFLVRARAGGPGVHVQPDLASPTLTGLYYDTYLPVLDQQLDATGVIWYHVELWGTLSGWIRVADTVAGDPPTPTPTSSSDSSGGSPSVGSLRGKVFGLSAQGTTNDSYVLRDDSSLSANQVSVLPAAATVIVDGWKGDDAGSVWYHVRAGDQSGWIWGGGVELKMPDPATYAVGGSPVWAGASGKGMWLAVPLMDMANPIAVVTAAKALGLTHIYLEVGDSNRGFYGQADVDRLLPVARAAGVSVIGWILTRLDDVPVDVKLSSTIASYKTPDGFRLDGIAPDLEFNMASADVQSYSQILRSLLGPDELIVGVIYPAGTEIAVNHPVAAILSHSFNALAPMDYWHDRERDYSPDEVTSFIRQTVDDIHAAVGNPNYPVAVIGQSYDGFSRNGAGPSSPSGAEVASALASARDAGAVGVSLFQWGTTTPAEWDALRQLVWAGRA